MQSRRLVVLLFLLFGLCVAPALGEKVVPTKDPTLNDAEQKLSTDLLQLTNSSHLPPGLSRQALVDVMQQEDRYRGPGRAVRGDGSRAPSEIVYVYVTLAQGTSLSTVDPFAWRVRNRDESSRTVAAWVEVSRLLTLAAVPGVTQIQPVIPPVTNTGSVTAESDRIHLADQVRAQYGLTGAGVRIGVISDGVDHWSSAVATGNLPADLHVLRNAVGGDEGIAMLEIVHDIAPGAELYFHDCGENTIDFNSGVDALADAGCTVIVDDISWITQPFFEDGSVAAHIQSLASTRDLIYLSSAGNAGQRHYQGTYRNDGYDYHDFSDGSGSPYKSLYVRIPSGGSLRTVLEWDDPWTRSANDYALCLVDTSTWNFLAVSDDLQDGDGAPLEGFSYRNTGPSTIEAEIDVYKYAGGADRTLEVYIYPADGTQVYTNNIGAADSVFGHAAAPNVVSVGAIRAADPGADTIEAFSSQGPATLRYPGVVQRMKPDVTGIDGVGVTGAGGFPNPFYGTSASAPGVAAVSALVWSGAPTMTATRVRTALLSSSVDLGSAGADTTFGYGRVNAVAFAQALGILTHPAIASITPNTGIRGSTVPISNLAGTEFLTGATVTLNRTGETDITATSVVVASPTRITCQFALPSTAATGTWNVVVANPDGQTATLPDGFTITPPAPTAAFTATPSTGMAPLSVQFTDASSGTIDSRRWDFGDGSPTSDQQSPSHVYTTAGTYTVNLTVTNGGGSNSTTRTVSVAPRLWIAANFEANATSGPAPLTVQFTDTSTGGVYYWAWEFGDGATSTERNPVHTFTAAGTYSVRLLVSNYETTDRHSLTVTVTDLPSPVVASTGYFLVSTAPAGAEIYFESIAHTRYHMGNTTAGPLNVRIYLTATPIRKIVANLTGYRDAVWNVTQYPPKDGTVPVSLVLEPIAGPAPGVLAVPGGAGLPGDLDGDGLCEDVNGNGRVDFADVVLLFNQMSWIAGNEPNAVFDWNANGRVDFADVVWLFNHL